jgi:hypothetical protein
MVMRLTVGPLPAAVYWRRRAVVLVGLAIVVLIVSYACGGPSSSGAQNTAATNSPEPAVTSREPPHPFVPDTSATASPTPTAFSLVTSAASGPCSDDEIELIATAEAATVAPKQTVAVTLKIKNISSRTCSRDVGADAQELRLQDASGIVWSSDDCNPRHGVDVRSYPPGKQDTFTLTWTGLRSRSGTGAPECSGTTGPAVGVYDLVARLDKKYSAPFSLKIAASATGS